MTRTKHLVYLSLMISQSLVLYIIESFLPPLAFIAPGAKLGLANIITVSVLYISGFRDAFTVLTMRILISSLFAGGISSFLYSLGGGTLSIFAMYFAKKLHKLDVSIIGVSVAGALFFNIGQMLVAAAIIKNLAILVYLPVLSYVSVGTGIFVGIVSKFMVERMSFMKFVSYRQQHTASENIAHDDIAENENI